MSIVMRAFHHSAYVMPQMTRLRIGHLGDFCIGQVYNVFLGQVTTANKTDKPTSPITTKRGNGLIT